MKISALDVELGVNDIFGIVGTQFSQRFLNQQKSMCVVDVSVSSRTRFLDDFLVPNTQLSSTVSEPAVVYVL
jgi:hypothetical protein